MTVRAELAVADLLSGPSDRARLDHLRAEGLADRSGLEWVMDQAQDLVHDDPKAAEELCRLCGAAAGELDLPAVAARVHYLRARIATERGSLETGLQLIGRARAEWQRAGHPIAALRTDLGRMQVLDDLGRHAEALAVGEALLSAVDELPPDAPDFGLARAIRAHAIDNMGAAYGLVGEHERALSAYVRAEAEYYSLGLHSEAARPLANRGVELLALGRPREAKVDLEAAVAAFQATGDRMFAAKCQGFLAHAHQQLGELVKALAVLEDARVTLEQLGAGAEATRLLLAVAETHLAIGLWPEAQHEASAVVARTRQTGMAHDEAMAHLIRALAAIGAGQPDLAEADLERAAALFGEVGDRQHAARVQLALAEVAVLRDDRKTASVVAGRAVEALRAGGWQVPLAWARLRLADLAEDGAAADAALAEAGALIRQLRLPQLSYQHRLRLARRASRDGNKADAEALLLEAIEDLSRSSWALPDHAMRTAFRADKLAAYDELVTLLLDRGRPDDLARARQLAGEAKATTLRDLLTESVGAGPDLNRAGSELASASADLGATYLALQGAADPARQALLRRQADEQERRVSSLRLQEATLVSGSAPAPSRTAEATQAEQARPPTCEFHVIGDDVVIFAQLDGTLVARRLRGILPRVRLELDRLDDQWARFELGSVFQQRHQALMLRTTTSLLGRLYDLILRPIGELLDRIVDERLHLVPHRLIGQVPFQALFDGQRFLAERFALTMLPTAPAAAQPPVPRGHAVVIAVPDAAAPAVAAEARAVAALLPGATELVGAAATTAALTAHVPGARLVHLACHGVFRRGNPIFSRLRLADRWMTSAEILRLDLSGALIVLSACESGQHGHGGEPVGLSWAFLAAGASGVVASQWVVHDDVTRLLMTEFHRGLAAGSDPAQALRHAQLAVAGDHPNPFFWAPFSYVAAPDLPTPRSPTRSTT